MFSPKGVKLIYFILILSFFSACSVQQSSRYDYRYLYDESQKLIKPSFKIFHHSEDSSTLFFEINSNDILYGKLGRDTVLSARILGKYILYDEEGEKIIDSATVSFFNSNEHNESYSLQSFFKIAVPQGKAMPLEVRFRDEYRDLNVVNYLWIDKRKNGNPQFYLLKDQEKVLFNDRIEQEDSVQLYKSPLLPEGPYLLKYSSTSFEMTSPPFSSNSLVETHIDIDSSQEVYFIKDSLQLTNFSTHNGIQPLNGDFETYYIHHYYRGFPELTQHEQMLEPLRYISTNQEYNALIEAIDKKEAVDAFWLKVGGSETSAKKMLKEFYQRVITANRFFSDYKEGWKTDRGIIYIVYGKPNTVYKTLNMERWVYGDESSLLSISFEFYNRKHEFGENYFQMIRSEEYKNNWYRMVDNWRQSR